MKAILSTDMARHFNYVDQLKKRVSATNQLNNNLNSQLNKMLSFKKDSS